MLVKVNYARPLSGDILEAYVDTNAPAEEVKKIEEFLKNDSSSDASVVKNMLMLKGYNASDLNPDVEISI